MYHQVRNLHKWIGVLNALFLMLISLTGFLLAVKSSVSWVRPAEQEGTPVEDYRKVISVDEAMKAAFAVGHKELAAPSDIDRVDYRPKRNVFKIVAKKGYHEVQVDGSSGKVLQDAKRTDQFIEDLHDMSFFGDGVHKFLLPAVALSLFGLSVSGICVWTTPILRRRKFEKTKGKKGTATTKDT